MMPTFVTSLGAKVAAAATAAVLLAGGGAGASAALGGPNLDDSVHSLLTTSSSESPQSLSATPSATPPGRVAATNPDGHCITLPNTSDIVKQPNKHPGWHVLGGGCPATPTPTPASAATPTLTATSGATPNPTACAHSKSDDMANKQAAHADDRSAVHCP